MKIAESGCPVDFFGGGRFQVLEKRRQREFGLVENQMIHFPELIRFRGEKRSAGNDFQPSRLAAVDDVFRGLPAERPYPPMKAISAQARSSSVSLSTLTSTKPLVKFFRQHGRDGEQAQRGVGRFLPDNFNAYLKLQNVFGKAGLIRSMFILGCLLWLLFH